MDIINKIIAAFSSAAEQDRSDYSETDKFLAHQQIFQALHICLYDLAVDGHLPLEPVYDSLDDDVLDVAANDITAQLFEQDIMSIETKAAAIRAQCLQFYPEALLLYTSSQADAVNKILHGDDTALADILPNALSATNEEMAEVNDLLHNRFLGYMGYDEDMSYDKIVRIVQFAYENNMIAGKSIENWFPVAYANMPTTENDKVIAPKTP